MPRTKKNRENQGQTVHLTATETQVDKQTNVKIDGKTNIQTLKNTNIEKRQQ